MQRQFKFIDKQLHGIFISFTMSQSQGKEGWIRRGDGCRGLTGERS